jgi:hypothetical protein
VRACVRERERDEAWRIGEFEDLGLEEEGVNTRSVAGKGELQQLQRRISA